MAKFLSRLFDVVHPLWIILAILLFVAINYLLKKYLNKNRARSARGEENEENEDPWVLCYNEASTLTAEQYKKISIGAIYSQQQDAYINSLTTGLDADRVTTIVENWWGLHDREAAVAKLDYLAGKGFEFYFPAVYKAYLTPDEQEQVRIIREGMVPAGASEEDEEVQEDLGKAFQQLEYLTDAYDELLEGDVVSSPEEIGRYGVIGWDCGRLNFLARLCYDAGYLSEAEAWHYIDLAYDKARESFDSWHDMAVSYVIGRAMWGGKNNHNLYIAYEASCLLRQPESPWCKFNFK